MEAMPEEIIEQSKKGFEVIKFSKTNGGEYLITFRINGFLHSRTIHNNFIGNNGKADGIIILNWVYKEAFFIFDEDKNPFVIAESIAIQIDNLLSKKIP